MARGDFRFLFPWRVRYAEIDAQAIVFFPRYLQYANIGWMEYWRALGVPNEPAPDAPVFNIVRTTVDYRKPMRLDEGIDICVRCSRIGRTSMTTVFELHGIGQEDLRAEIELTSVHLDGVGGRPAPLPEPIVSTLETFENRRLRA